MIEIFLQQPTDQFPVFLIGLVVRFYAISVKPEIVLGRKLWMSPLIESYQRR